MEGLINILIMAVVALLYLALCLAPYFMRKLHEYQEKHTKEYSAMGRIWRIS